MSKIYGKNINFKKISNPFTKFALLVELLIFTTPQKFPIAINNIENIRVHLQIINIMEFVINLFLEIKVRFNITSTINFALINKLLKRNNAIRKKMFFSDIIEKKGHINRSFIIINKLLFKMRMEIAQFIESNALNERIIYMKEDHGILKYGSYLFVAYADKLLKIQRIKLTRNYFFKIIYNPWSFYFFFRHIKCLKNDFTEGIKERNKYLLKYLKFIYTYNDGKNLYTPFWYLDNVRKILTHIHKLIPKFFQNK